MLAAADATGCVRGAYVHYGAGQTGRFSSRGVQVHNLPRDTPSPEEFAVLREETLRGEVRLAHTARTLRQCIVPRPGHVFVSADWSNIEARITPWIAGTRAARDKLAAFAAPDRDPYLETAEQIGYPGKRQMGKVVELALGFLGAEGALHSMANAFGITFTSTEAKRIVRRWRHENAWAVQLGDELLAGALEAFARPGSYTYRIGGRRWVQFMYLPDTQVLQGLLCGGEFTLSYQHATRRPGGKISYSAPRAFAPSKGVHAERSLWRGLVVENVVQATAALLLRETLTDDYVRAHCVLHTHDDVTLEVPAGKAQAAEMALTEVMTGEYLRGLVPGLPLEVECKIRDRYS